MMADLFAILSAVFANDLRPKAFKRHREPCSHTNWLFDLKYDGFRALAFVRDGVCRLLSSNGKAFGSFTVLNESIAAELDCNPVLAGEIVCLGDHSCSQFNELLRKAHTEFVLTLTSGPPERTGANGRRTVVLHCNTRVPMADSGLPTSARLNSTQITLSTLHQTGATTLDGYYEQRYRNRQIESLHKRAAKLGFQIVALSS